MQQFPDQMDVQVFEVPKAPMDGLRILTAGTGSKMALLDDTGLEGSSGLPGAHEQDRESHPAPLIPPPRSEYIQGCFSKAMNLRGARLRHSVTSLEDGAQKNISRISQPGLGTHARLQNDRRAD